MPGIYLNLDDAWGAAGLTGGKVLDLRLWGPRLRYHGTRAEVEGFYREVEKEITPFILYGSGDYHFLAGVFPRRIQSPVTVISFDNHPDWDIRPPHWACGGWVNRALELPNVRRVSVWGCGNFELGFPSRLFANQKALRSGALEVHAWAERQTTAVQRRFNCMTRNNWRERFDAFADTLKGKDLYVTVDLDCLCAGEAITNWENGLFTADDVAWAVTRLRRTSIIVAGDVCGAYSPPRYARWFQRLAGSWDHPRRPPVNWEQARQLNAKALHVLWPALTGEDPAARRG